MSFLGATLGNLHIPSIGGIKKQISKVSAVGLWLIIANMVYWHRKGLFIVFTIYYLHFSRAQHSVNASLCRRTSWWVRSWRVLTTPSWTTSSPRWRRSPTSSSRSRWETTSVCPSLWLNIQMSPQLASLSKPQGLFATHSVFCSDGDVRENPWYSVSEPRGASEASLRQGNSFHWSKLLSYLVSRVR